MEDEKVQTRKRRLMREKRRKEETRRKDVS